MAPYRKTTLFMERMTSCDLSTSLSLPPSREGQEFLFSVVEKQASLLVITPGGHGNKKLTPLSFSRPAFDPVEVILGPAPGPGADV
jgi:hypothetical protein